MKLKFFNIKIQSPDDFVKSINSAINSKKTIKALDSTTIKFDSEKTFNQIFTLNKLQILRVITQLKPESIYKLAHYLDREPHHVLKDCRQLESLKFIKLKEANTNGRSTLKASLVFDFDVIKVYSKNFVQPFPVSEKAEKLISGVAKTS